MGLGLGISLLLIATLAVPISRARTGDFFTPSSLFVATWCGALGLYSLKLLPYPPMERETLWFIVAAITIVVAAALLGQRMAREPGRRAARPGTVADAWIVAYSLVALAGVAWYLWLVVTILGVDAFGQANRIRTALGTYEIPSAFLFLEYFCIATPLLAAALVMTGTRLHPATLLGPVLCALATWLTTDRTQFFVLMLGLFFMYVFRLHRRLSWPGLIAAGVVAGVLLGSNFLLVGAWLGKTPENLGVLAGLPSAPSATPAVPPAGTPTPADRPTAPSSSADATGARERSPLLVATLARLEALIRRGTTLYLYATGSFAALDLLLDDPPAWTGGLHTVYPVARLLQRSGMVDGPIPSDIPPYRTLRLQSGAEIQFNSYTFLYYPWMDFGWWGALAYAGGIGLLGGTLYGFARQRRDSPVFLLLVAHLFTALALSVFVNKFNNTATWYVTAATLAPFVLSVVRRAGR
jgi:hypothetical protein